MSEETERFVSLLEKDEIIDIPGGADALTAKLIQEAGFPAVYVTGAGISNTQLGLADVGLTTMHDVLRQAQKIVQAVDVPVIADCDTGYGNPINVMRTVREFERSGLAGIQIEDQVEPKKCGHFEGKEVISKQEMVNKVKAAVRARRDPNFTIIARTDARAIYGFDEAIERAEAYTEAGADINFVEAPRSREELRMIPESLDAPQIANMVEGGKTPLLTVSELEEIGFKIVIHANLALRAGVKAIQEALNYLAEHGESKGIMDKMITMEKRNELTDLPQLEELEEKYSST